MTDDAKREVKLPFHYIKSNAFRVIHVDGATGGVNPRSVCQLALFSERLPIPQKVAHLLTPEGGLGPEVAEDRISREGLVREVEVEILMDLATARSVAELIQRSVTQFEEASKKVSEQKK